MCSNSTEMEIGTPDGAESPLSSEASNQPPAIVVANTGDVKGKANMRNVLIQHGDYRSVDEENIVVLKQCHSPQPPGTAIRAAGEDPDDDQPGTSHMDDEEQYLWIEPFADDDSEVSFR